MIKCGELLQSLLNLLDEGQRVTPALRCDETLLQVLKEPDWPARVAGPPGERIILYDYAPSRSGTTAKELPSGFQGYLQTDDYAAYHAVGRAGGVTHLGCWAHARRKFVEAQHGSVKKGKNAKFGRADVALRNTGKLYTI